MNKIIEGIEARSATRKVPQFSPGDTVLESRENPCQIRPPG